MTDKELDELTGFVFRSIVGLRFLDADTVFDEARRILWGCSFSGKPIPDTWEGPACTIARRLAHLPLDLVNQVIEEVRLSIWMVAFPNARPNLFGRLLDSATERQ